MQLTVKYPRYTNELQGPDTGMTLHGNIGAVVSNVCPRQTRELNSNALQWYVVVYVAALACM